MLNSIKTFFQFGIFGMDPKFGEPIDLTLGGKLRIKSTCEPENPLGFNEFWQHVYKENNKTTSSLGK
jgi:hypothetical protein